MWFLDWTPEGRQAGSSALPADDAVWEWALFTLRKLISDTFGEDVCSLSLSLGPADGKTAWQWEGCTPPLAH
ncbi:hypothetical protein CRENBAI_026116 [Crenichthys baileyi]|uniref:Uncharacterized protein n=1 Tax=Crenichthys baileyi TaxID=28760 RepID=A0AAV9S9A1_9TELE